VERVLDYQSQLSSQTLAQGVAEYYAAHPELDSVRGMSPEAQRFFRCHDVAHVVFGCGIDLHDEAVVKLSSIFGTTAGFGVLRGYSLHESRQIYEQLSLRESLRTVAQACFIVPRTLLRCTRQRARWPWDGFESFLETPLRRIREQFGITVARGAAASRSAHVA
jgi:ubiquinone biosynthesis protein Coq4